MYTLNPDYPLVWRTPTSLQFGIDRVAAVLAEVTPRQERVLALLQSRVSAATLRAMAAGYGMARGELEAFLRSLGAALWDSTRDEAGSAGKVAPGQRLRIAIDGRGAAAEATGRMLAAQGHTVTVASARVAPACDVALLFGSFVLEPHRAGDWLRRNIPALPIVFGNSRVDLGPLLGPELCACCVEMARCDADTAWPAIASQMMGTPSRLETPLLASEVATFVARWMLGEHPPTGTTQVQLDATTGERVTVTFLAHPECACRSLTQNANVRAVSDDRLPVEPMTVTASFAHA
jgi:hypothetical protein